MPYPNHLDLDVFLDERGLGCSDISVATKKAKLALAKRKWESESGWTPFLPTDEDPTTEVLNGPEGRIVFPSFGIISLTDFLVDGTEYVADEGFFLQNRFNGTGPYTQIEFDGYLTGARNSISLTGIFGYALEMPIDVKQALLSYVAYDLYPQITGIDGDVKREKQGPIEFEYQQSQSNGKSQGKRGALLDCWETTLELYRWVRL